MLRVLLNQPGQLPEFRKISRPISSRLLKPECLRALDRLRVGGHIAEGDFVKACEELYDALESLEFIEIDKRVLDRVGSSFPLPLGTLDAIHLASAILWRETSGTMLSFFTHDVELGRAARVPGFTALGCAEK